jgi:hypothetical protein
MWSKLKPYLSNVLKSAYWVNLTRKINKKLYYLRTIFFCKKVPLTLSIFGDLHLNM